MQIRIPRNELFEQLPRAVRHALVGEQVPEFFVFNVDTFEVGRIPNEKALRDEFPEVHETFTPIEWYMFCMMASQEGKEVPIGILGAKLRHNTGSNPSNGVSVHMKKIRRKLEELGAPVRIRTYPGSRVGGGSYAAERVNV